MKLLSEDYSGVQNIYIVDDTWGIRHVYSQLFNIIWKDDKGQDVDINDLIDKNIYKEIKLSDLPKEALKHLTNLEYIQLKANDSTV